MKTNKPFRLQAPCEKMGDEFALSTVIFHYWCATIIGWSWAIVGAFYHAIAFATGTFSLNAFAKYWVVNAVFAMVASFMTLGVYVYKQVIAVLRDSKYSHLVAEETEKVEETEVYNKEVIV
jgi:hypothetical protein